MKRALLSQTELGSSFILREKSGSNMESLTHTFSIQALLVLLKEGHGMTVEEIAEAIGEPQGSVVHAIDALSGADLVEAKVRRAEPYIEDVSLTSAGKITAEKLKEIESVIGWVGHGGVT
jgi:DNA-binding MarR family transcriptional regulator